MSDVKLKRIIMLKRNSTRNNLTTTHDHNPRNMNRITTNFLKAETVTITVTTKKNIL